MVFDGFHDSVGAAASELARCLDGQISTDCAIDQGSDRSRIYRRAGLEVKSADRGSVVHCVEGSDLVHSHRGHLQNSSNLIHDADTRKAMLALSEVKKRHHRRFLVLWGVAFEDLIDELLIDGVELERDVRVIVRSVSMLHGAVSVQDLPKCGPRSHTT